MANPPQCRRSARQSFERIQSTAELPLRSDGPRIPKGVQGAKLNGKTLEQIKKEAMSVRSLKRLVDPKDIATLAVFVASDAAKSIWV
jgi:NAD(P)-dependent dehydrogenase (short-subunit alcohol dehydrogenase family)